MATAVLTICMEVLRFTILVKLSSTAFTGLVQKAEGVLEDSALKLVLHTVHKLANFEISVIFVQVLRLSR